MSGRSLLSAESNNLNLLRGCAVLLVLIGHILETWGFLNGTDFHPWDWHLGRMGVLLFFVHTALVLSASIARDEGSHNTLRFYVRRVFRIFPLSIIAVLFVVALQIPPTPWTEYEDISLSTVVANVTLTTDLVGASVVLAPLWTLPVEVQIYALLPLAYWFVGGASARPHQTLWLSALVIPVAAAQVVLDTRFVTAAFLPCFTAGIVSFSLRNSVTKKLSHGLWPAALLGVLALYLAVCHFLLSRVHNIPLQWIFCFALALLIPCFKELPSDWWSSTWLRIARYSYGIYLFHCMVLYALVKFSYKGGLLSFSAIAILGTALISVAAYHMVEAPMIRIGARLTRRARRPAIA